MNRRTLLGAVGGTLTVGLAGCTGLGSASEKPRDDSGTPDDDPTETPESNAGETEKEDDNDDEGDDGDERPTTVHDSLVLPGKAGDDAEIRPHGVRLLNDVDRERAIGLTLAPADDERPLREVTASFDVPAGDAVEVELQRPATYSVSVRVEGTTVTEFDIDETWFDCNSSSTIVTLGADGAVDRTELSTLIACSQSTVEKPGDSE